MKTEEAEYQAKHVLLATGMQVDSRKIGLQILLGKEPRMKARVAVDDEEDGRKSRYLGSGNHRWRECPERSSPLAMLGTSGINIISELNGERYVTTHDVPLTEMSKGWPA